MKRVAVFPIAAGIIVLALTSAIAQDTPVAPAQPTPLPVLPRLCILQGMRFLSPVTLPTLAAQLNLTDEQKTRVLDLLNNADETLKPLVEAHRKAAEEFAVALAKPESDQASLLAAAEKANKAEMAMMTQRIKTFTELRALLDDKQKAELGKFVEGRTRWWRETGTTGQVPVTLPPPTPPAGQKQ